MGTSRGKDPDAKREKELAKALAQRGQSATGTVVSMRETGRTRSDGAASEIDFALRFSTGDGRAVEVGVQQFMNGVTLTGLAPGEPVTLMYDRDDPSRVMVQQSPKYVFVKNPNQAFDGNSVVAVPVAEAGQSAIVEG